MKIWTWLLAVRMEKMSSSGWSWNKITSWGKHGWHRTDGNKQNKYESIGQLAIETNVNNFFTLPYFCSQYDSVLLDRHLVPHVVIFLAYGVTNFIAPKNSLTGLQLFPSPPTLITELWWTHFLVLRKRFKMSQNFLICEWSKPFPKALVPENCIMHLVYFLHSFPLYRWGRTGCMT